MSGRCRRNITITTPGEDHRPLAACRRGATPRWRTRDDRITQAQGRPTPDPFINDLVPGMAKK
ncbi:MAG: hypothetical protein H7270_02940 [Dermatophilaceae bacterium]|nr:hypothetical protein [Dermatophilaceae bacterium]